MLFIWTELLFRPLLNLLIGLYNTIGFQNLGWTVVWLTVIVRILLLPISLRDKRGKVKEDELRKELAVLQRRFANNPSILREEQRKLFRRIRFRRWPKVISLIVQGLILLVLYQVFLGGINVAEIVDQLYSWVYIPFSINTTFLEYFDIAERSFILSFLCGLLLFANIWLGYRKVGKQWRREDLLYGIGFPVATTLVLWYLPSVKAIFILTSMLFSNVVRGISSFSSSIKQQSKDITTRYEDEAKAQKENLPKVEERF